MGNPETENLIDKALQQQSFPLGPEHLCPYLPGRQARQRGFWANRLDAEFYFALMNRGFRRSGKIFYQPSCVGCQACIPIRIPVAGFQKSESQRRVWRKNQNVQLHVQKPAISIEKWYLYNQYQQHLHDGSMGDRFEDLYNFLYDSPVHTLEFCYFIDQQLAGVSILDISSQSLSSVYMYYNPTFADRSLGTYSVLREIEYCREKHTPYYYLGFYVKNCRKMSYKANFKPYELLTPSLEWRHGISDSTMAP